MTPNETDDVYEWFPELHDISDEHLRRETADALFSAPDYFWTAPASSRHHPEDHRSRHGLVLHVKRAVSVFERLAPSMTRQGHMTDENVDEARSALLLHDVLKYGDPPTDTGSGTSGKHDVLVRDWLEDTTDLPKSVTEAAASHNGPWYAGPPPTTHTGQMVHVSDMVASCEYINIGVKSPNKVLQNRFPALMQR